MKRVAGIDFADTFAYPQIQTTMAFEYSRLPAGAIRLMRVLPDTQDRILRFEIGNFGRALAPPYTAVSYTWGDEEATELIYLNRRPFSVRPNLWGCLYYLRSDAWKYIWVDAICIDQRNVGEKTEQVGAMGSTYSHAAHVSVWLGLVPIPDFIVYHGPITDLDNDDFDWADSMADLANRPYWSRTWVIQEMLLAKDVHLYCSGNRIDWLMFQENLGRELGMDLLSTSIDKRFNSAVKSHPALALAVGRHIDRHPEIQEPLYELLVRHQYSICKDRRDRVFALLALLPHDERAFIGRFFPDYSLSEDEVIVITLAHLTHYRPSTDKLDLGKLLDMLGVAVDAKHRRRLLSSLQRFDYYDDPAYRPCSYFQDEINELDPYEGQETDDTDVEPRRGRRTASFGLCFQIFCGFLLLSGVALMASPDLRQRIIRWIHPYVASDGSGPAHKV